MSLGNKIYLLGGRTSDGDFSRGVFAYDPSTNHWSECAPMLRRRANFGLVSHQGKIYVIGGIDPSTTRSSTVQHGNSTMLNSTSTTLGTIEEFDPTLNSWTQKTEMETPRTRLTAVESGDQINVLGGTEEDMGESLTIGNTFETYEARSNSWTKKSNAPLGFLTACSTTQGIVAIGMKGGFAEAGWAIATYDNKTNLWSHPVNIEKPMFSASIASTAGRFYASSIQYRQNVPSAEVQVFDPSRNSWAKETPLPTALEDGASVVAGCTMYVIGGFKHMSNFAAKIGCDCEWNIAGLQIKPIAFGDSGTTVFFEIPGPADVWIRVYSGKKIARTLRVGQRNAGRNQVLFDGKDDSGKFLNPGNYVCYVQGVHQGTTSFMQGWLIKAAKR